MRLAVITVGKTHSGKTIFARTLEQGLPNSLMIDQDNHAEFINTFYNTLQPKQGPNTLKYAVSQTIVDYAVNQTNLHLIISNSNRKRKDRSELLKQFHEKGFISILVHFNFPDHILQTRVTESQRSTNILRSASNFEEVLNRQQTDTLKEEVSDPKEGEADHLFVVEDNEEVESVIQRIIRIT